MLTEVLPVFFSQLESSRSSRYPKVHVPNERNEYATIL